MTREEFMVYLNHLNNKEHEQLRDFLTDDVTLEFCDNYTLEKQKPKVLHGIDEYFAHFYSLHAKADEHMELGFCLFDGENLLTEQYTEFRALEDLNLLAGPLKKGEAFCNTNWLCYNFAPDGRINRIRIAHHICNDTPPRFV